MTRFVFLILPPCLLLAGCVAAVPRVAVDTSTGMSDEPSQATLDANNKLTQAATATAATQTTALDEETQELLEKLRQQDGIDRDRVAQLRNDLAAAAPESQPFLKSLLALTVGAREMSDDRKPPTQRDTGSAPSNDNLVGQQEETRKAEKVAVGHQPTARNRFLPPTTMLQPADAAALSGDFVPTMPESKISMGISEASTQYASRHVSDTPSGAGFQAAGPLEAGSTTGNIDLPHDGHRTKQDAWQLFTASPSDSDQRADEEQPQDWQACVTAAIEALENEFAWSDDDTDVAQREAKLRMLYLVANDRVRAAQPIADLKPHEQEFWSHQLHALALLLDREQIPSSHRRAAAALAQLQVAEQKLAEGSGLQLKNLAFCTDVVSFGVYEEFGSNVFQPEQEVQLYVEVENFSAVPSSQGYETAFRGSYRILDSSGQPVFEHTYPTGSEICRNRRRDLFIRYRMWMPKRMNPGRYTLELEVEDVKGKKFGQTTQEFTVAR